MGGLNTLIDELHNNLINDINKSQLPVGIIYFVIKDVFSEVERGYIEELKNEKNLDIKETSDNSDDITEEIEEEN